MTEQTKDPILQRLEADAVRAQNTLEVARRWLGSGKTLVVQHRYGMASAWADCADDFTNEIGEYRIRPEPRVIWVPQYRDGLGQVHLDEGNARNFLNYGAIGVVKFQEVIE